MSSLSREAKAVGATAAAATGAAAAAVAAGGRQLLDVRTSGGHACACIIIICDRPVHTSIIRTLRIIGLKRGATSLLVLESQLM